MSWASTISGWVNTPNKSSRDGRRINGWIIHHNAARGGSYVLSIMESGSKQVSAQYQVLEDGRGYGVVPRELRSWSVSNADWDGESITFEIANNSGGPEWTISDAAYDFVARTIAEDARWAGIPINRTTVRGHREGSAQGAGGSYSTACPGGIDLDYLVRLAQKYYDAAATAATEQKEIDMPTYELVRQEDRPEVYFSVDRVQRYHVPSEAVLKDYVYFVRAKGQPATVTVVKSIASFGADITPKGVVTATLTPETIDAIVAEVAAELDEEAAS